MNDQPSKYTINGRYVGAWTHKSDSVPMRFLQHGYESARSVAMKALAKRDELAKDTRFTDEGRRDAAREWAKTEALKEAATARRAIKSARAKMEEKVKAAKPVTIDKTDAAAAIIRQEMRQALRTMPPHQRAALIAQAQAEPEKHPDLVAALIEVPVQFSGISEPLYNLLTEKSVELNNPGLREQFEEMEAAIQSAERALHAATSEIASVTGLQPVEIVGMIETASQEPQERAVAGTLPDGSKLYYAGAN
jgi:hypothetical protein